MAGPPCDGFAFWRLSAIVVVALIGLLIKYLTILVKLINRNRDILPSWAKFLMTILFELLTGFIIQKFLNIRNMWKSPFDPLPPPPDTIEGRAEAAVENRAARRAFSGISRIPS